MYNKTNDTYLGFYEYDVSKTTEKEKRPFENASDNFIMGNQDIKNITILHII